MDMYKGQCIAQLEKVQLFGDNEEYHRNKAPLYASISHF